MKTIPINNGYYQYKSLNQKQFLARVSEALCDNVSSGCDTLVIDDTTYLVGIGKYNIDKDKTENELHTKILVLNMLAKFVDSKPPLNKEVFNLVLSAPPGMFKVQSKSLPPFLKGNYQITVNSTPMDITINQVKVYPETFIVAMVYPELFKNKTVIIFDMGGVTTNIVRVTNNTFTNEDFVTIKYGMYNIDEDIQNYLNGKPEYKNDNFQPEDIQYMRDTKHEILVREEPFISKIYDKHIDNMLNKMTLKGWNYNLYPIFCTGGGSKVVFDSIQSKVETAILSPDPIFDNEKALEKLAARELIKQ